MKGNDLDEVMVAMLGALVTLFTVWFLGTGDRWWAVYAEVCDIGLATAIWTIAVERDGLRVRP